MGKGENVAWVDAETTGLDPDDGLLLEVAVIVTDSGLRVLDSVEWLVGNDITVGALKKRCHPKVAEMHTANGLWDALAHTEALTDRECLDDELAALLAAHDKPMLGGRNPSFDRAWLERWLPKSAAQLHYRHIDETGMQWLFKGAGLGIGQSSNAHRAGQDISECLYRVMSYRERLEALAEVASSSIIAELPHSIPLVEVMESVLRSSSFWAMVEEFSATVRNHKCQVAGDLLFEAAVWLTGSPREARELLADESNRSKLMASFAECSCPDGPSRHLPGHSIVTEINRISWNDILDELAQVVVEAAASKIEPRHTSV